MSSNIISPNGLVLKLFRRGRHLDMWISSLLMRKYFQAYWKLIPSPVRSLYSDAMRLDSVKRGLMQVAVSLSGSFPNHLGYTNLRRFWEFAWRNRGSPVPRMGLYNCAAPTARWYQLGRAPRVQHL